GNYKQYEPSDCPKLSRDMTFHCLCPPAAAIAVGLVVPSTFPSAAGGRRDFRHLDSDPPATNLTRINGIRAPLTRTPSSSANPRDVGLRFPRLARRIGRSRVRSPDTLISHPLLLAWSSTRALRSNTVSAREHVTPNQGEIIEPSNVNERAAAALVTVGAMVAVADRRVLAVERDEVVHFISDLGLAVQ